MDTTEDDSHRDAKEKIVICSWRDKHFHKVVERYMNKKCLSAKKRAECDFKIKVDYEFHAAHSSAGCQ